MSPRKLSWIAFTSLTTVLVCSSQVLAETRESNTGENNLRARITEKMEPTQERLENLREKVTQNVEERKEELVDRVKSKISNYLDHWIDYLEGNLKEKVEKHPNISTYANITDTQIDALVAELRQLQEKVNQATTLDELRAIGTEARGIQAKIEAARKRNVGLILAARFKEFVERMEKVTTKIETKLDTLQSEGKDISAAQDELNSYKSAIQSAKTKIQEAIDIFSTITPETKNDGIFTQGRTKLYEGKKLLHEAGRALHKSVQELKEKEDE